MILGRDESMPNMTKKEEELSSNDRDMARQFAEATLAAQKLGYQTIAIESAVKMAKAVLRYCPEGVPEAAPHMVSSADNLTMPMGGVLGEIEHDSSDGICEPTGDDDDATRQAVLNHTTMHRSQDGVAFIVKKGGAESVTIPAVPPLPDRTRR